MDKFRNRYFPTTRNSTRFSHHHTDKTLPASFLFLELDLLIDTNILNGKFTLVFALINVASSKVNITISKMFQSSNVIFKSIPSSNTAQKNFCLHYYKFHFDFNVNVLKLRRK